jgi:hypothetical protein
MMGSDYEKTTTLAKKKGIIFIIQDWYQQVFSKIPETQITLEKSLFMDLLSFALGTSSRIWSSFVEVAYFSV